DPVSGPHLPGQTGKERPNVRGFDRVPAEGAEDRRVPSQREPLAPLEPRRRPSTRDVPLSGVPAQAFPALARPHVVELVDRLERRHALREREPRHLAPREDVDVRRDGARIVERPGTDEQARARDDVVAAPYGGAARIAEEDVVPLPAAAGQRERPRGSAARGDAFLLDPVVDHEGAARDALAVAAVAYVHDQRAVAELVPDRAACASSP